VIRRALSTAARIASRRRYRVVLLGSGCRVDFWKLKAKADNYLRVGANSLLASRVVYERPDASLTIGARSFVGLGLMSIAERVDIGDDVMVSWGATIIDHNSHSMLARQRVKDVERWMKGEKDWSGVRIEPVQIGNYAWLGFNVAVFPGVTIGEGAIIGACSVVTKSVPSWTIAGGNPARVLREMSADERA
jgi:acetyltransferase-like isoleucine patch superfamily enzyme